MQIPYLALCTVVIGTWSSGHGPAWAQNYPSKPVRIVTAEPGGGNDLASRLIAQGLTASLGQQVIVDNRGGSGLAAGDAVYKAQADGHTLLLYGSNIWISPLLRKTAWDPLKDFSAITLVNTAPNILVVNPALSVNSVRELIALAKARPGALNYASSGIGSSTHLAGELFRALAGVDIVRINYKGVGAALTDLIAGQVQLIFGSAAAVAPHIKSGKLKALAVTTAQPSAVAPGLPTIAGAGVPGYESGVNVGMFAPAHTPAALVRRLNQETLRVLRTAEVKDKFLSAGVEAAGTTPEHFGTLVKTEMARLGKVVRDAGIRVE